MSSFNTVSVITPSFNQAQFLEETILSVLTQEGDFYLEYFIMDGLSTDQSIDIIKKYDELIQNDHFPLKCQGIKFEWVSEKDKGQAHAINKGLKRATGVLQTYINSDDLLAKDIIQKYLKSINMLNHQCVLYGNLEYIDESSKPFKVYNPGQFDIKRMLFENQLCQPGVFWTKTAVDDSGLFNEDYHYSFDYDQWLKFYPESKFHYINEISAQFRIHENQKGMTIPLTCIIDQIDLFETFFKRNELNKKIIQSSEKVFLKRIFDLFLYANATKNLKVLKQALILFIKKTRSIAGIIYFMKLFYNRLLIYMNIKQKE